MKLMFGQGFLKVMNKHSYSNVNRKFFQSYLVFNSVIKHTQFMEHFFPNVLVGRFLNVATCF